MKILKKILIGFISLIALILLVALFIPNNYTISVTGTIHKPKKEVFDYLRLLKNQELYNVWLMADPNLHPEIIGKDGAVGALQKWNSNMDEVGEGEQQITALTEDKINIDIRFKRPFEGVAKAATIFKSINETKTELTSEFYSEAKYPFNLMAYTFGRKMLTTSMETNIANIKKNLELTKPGP